MSEGIEKVLRGAGLSDRPEEFDSSIHSWRCEHPDVYGRCTCFQELVQELAAIEREAAARALASAADDLDNADDPQQFKNPTSDAPLGWTNESIETALMSSGVITDWLRARAAEIREGMSE